MAFDAEFAASQRTLVEFGPSTGGFMILGSRVRVGKYLFRLRQMRREVGFFPALAVLAGVLFYRLCRGMFIKVLTLERDKFRPRSTENSLGLTLLAMTNPDQIANRTDLWRFTDSPDDPEHLEPGTSCWALIDGTNVACRAWFRTRPIAMAKDLPFLITLCPEWEYLYGLLTNRQYRGRRLVRHLTAQALLEFDRQNKKGILALVRADNRSSMRAFRDMGYRVRGLVFCFKALGKHYMFASPGCRSVGLTFTRRTGS